MELQFQLQSGPENPKAVQWELGWGRAAWSKPPELQETAKLIPSPSFKPCIILHCHKLGCGEDLQLPRALSHTALLPNCLHGRDLDQRFSHLKRRRSPDWLPTQANNNTNSSSSVYWGRTRLCSWWWIRRKAKVIKWFSTELRSLSKSICQTEVKHPGIKMEFTANKAAKVIQRNSSLRRDSPKDSFTCTLFNW